MTQPNKETALPVCVKLQRRFAQHIGPSFADLPAYINPDGPEAAALISELYAALAGLKLLAEKRGMRTNGHPWTVGAFAAADAALLKAESGQ